MTKTTTHSRQYSWQKRQREEGLCPYCKNPAEEGYKSGLCRSHRLKRNAKREPTRRHMTAKQWANVDFRLSDTILAIILGLTPARVRAQRVALKAGEADSKLELKVKHDVLRVLPTGFKSADSTQE